MFYSHAIAIALCATVAQADKMASASALEPYERTMG